MDGIAERQAIVKLEPKDKQSSMALKGIVDDPVILFKRERYIEQLQGELNYINSSHQEAVLTGQATSQIDTLKQKFTEIKIKIVESQANYPGDWSLLLYSRLKDQSTREKFQAIYDRLKDTFLIGEPGNFDKDRAFQTYQKKLVEELDDRVDRVFQTTEFGPAEYFNESPQSLGTKITGGQSYEKRFTHPGAVFTDAIDPNNLPLSEKGKNIIESHEKGHAVREFYGAIGEEVRNVLDFTKFDRRHRVYFANADEIIERMSQLKNYFGFKANEQFTQEHLAYARKHYVSDTGLDNSMQYLMDAVTPDKESTFLQVMNSYPI